jgi:dihydropteroate synthase
VVELQFKLMTLDWRRTYVMGVMNATPDSFSGSSPDPLELLAQGATLVDVGGESTRPGAAPVGAAEELARVLPVLRRARGRVTLSIDTYKAEVAAAALEAGAELVNDISGGTLEPEILRVAAAHEAALIIGHLRGTPADMQSHACYTDVVREVREELAERLARAREAGVKRLLVDPGLGFAKSAEHNLTLLRQLESLRALGCPIVIGASRKSFLGKLTGRPVADRELATAAADTAAILHGANIVRVHDVAAQLAAVQVADALRDVGRDFQQ